jgi:putative membrane protein
MPRHPSLVSLSSALLRIYQYGGWLIHLHARYRPAGSFSRQASGKRVTDNAGARARTNQTMAESRSASPSDYLAAERTFLAWIRTGLALMGFGFVVARFGLFLREIAMTTHTRSLQSSGVSLWIGTTLLLIGVCVNVAASIHHVGLIGKLKPRRSDRAAVRRCDRGGAGPCSPRTGIGGVPRDDGMTD